VLLHPTVCGVPASHSRTRITTRASQTSSRTDIISTGGVPARLSMTVRRRDALLAAVVTLPCVLAPSSVATARAEESSVLVDGLEGLRFTDEVVGKGPRPFEGDVVKVNYEARLVESGESTYTTSTGGAICVPLLLRMEGGRGYWRDVQATAATSLTLPRCVGELPRQSDGAETLRGVDAAHRCVGGLCEVLRVWGGLWRGDPWLGPGCAGCAPPPRPSSLRGRTSKVCFSSGALTHANPSSAQLERDCEATVSSRRSCGVESFGDDV
jgi:hypothetical protein